MEDRLTWVSHQHFPTFEVWCTLFYIIDGEYVIGLLHGGHITIAQHFQGFEKTPECNFVVEKRQE